MHEYDVTHQSGTQGKVKDFLNYFQQKFLELETLLKKHPSFKPKEIKKMRIVSKNNEVDFIGMVSEKWITKNGHMGIRLEDLESSCIGLVMKDDRKLMKEKELIMPDNVIGVKATKASDELFIIKEIFWPDIPQRSERKIEEDVAIAGVSDIHVGSKLFLEKSFNEFLEWMNGRVESQKELEQLGKIKYLVITGDLCDGIGVYPGQFDELSITDIFEQYRVFEEYMLKIPEYVEVFVIPGNHDAVRNADPQPSLPKKLVPELYKMKNFHFLSSPGWLEIEGMKTVLYHGGSLHDLFSKVSFLSAAEPAKGCVELLRKRDFMTSYGMRKPYVPEKRDFMTIHEEPDLVFLGDHHRRNYAFYRGTTVINNSTFQARTAYQVKLGHIPTPGIIPIINLQTRKISEREFAEPVQVANEYHN